MGTHCERVHMVNIWINFMTEEEDKVIDGQVSERLHIELIQHMFWMPTKCQALFKSWDSSSY